MAGATSNPARPSATASATVLGIYALFLAILLLLQAAYWDPFWTEGAYGMRRAALLHAIGLAVALAAAGAAARLDRTSGPLDLDVRWALALVLGLGLLLPLLTSTLVLDGFPNSGDEYSFVHQARDLARGEFWHEPPPLGRAFVAMRTWIYEGRWVGQYPPGWPLLLAIAERLAVPLALVGPLCGAASVAALLAILWRWSDPWTAVALGALYATSAFYVFNAASFFSHIATAVMVLAYVALGHAYLERAGARNALLLGATLGAIGITRTYSALLLGLVFALAMLWERRRIITTDWLILAAGLPFLGLLLLYNRLVMGDPLVSTYAADFESVQFRFELSWGVLITTLRFFEELFAWTSPVFVALFACSFLAKLLARRLAFYDLVLPLFIGAYILQGWDGGNRYGPRYYADVYPVLFLTIATGLPALVGRLGGWSRALRPHVAAVALLYGASVLPFVVPLWRTIVDERQDPYRLAAAAGLADAIVLVTTPPGLVSFMNIYDLPRNAPGLDAPVLFANGAETEPEALRAAFPERSVWLYERAPEAAAGTLRPAP